MAQQIVKHTRWSTTTHTCFWIIGLLLSTLIGCKTLPMEKLPAGRATNITVNPALVDRFALPKDALRGLRLCLDPGAGKGPDHDLVLPLTLYLKNLASRAGATVVTTRFSLADRIGPDRIPILLKAARVDLLIHLACRTGPLAASSINIPNQAPGLGAIINQLFKAKKPHTTSAQPSLIPTLTANLSLPRNKGRTAFRKPAQLLAHGLADWWQDAADKVSKKRRQIYPARSSTPWQPRSCWPAATKPENEKEVARLINTWLRGYAVDRSQAWLEAKVERRANGWQLSGSVELPAMGKALKNMLLRSGVTPLTGSLRQLPDKQAGPDPFGLVTTAAALTWRHPTRGAGLSLQDGPGQTQQTEILFGEPVWILDARDDFLLVHSCSGYVGWVRQQVVRRLNQAAFTRWLAAPRAIFTTEALVNKTRIPVGTGLPLVAMNGRRAKLTLPNGKESLFLLHLLKLPSTGVGKKAARSALAALGTPYLWGGRSRLGLDCSGLVQTCWAGQGVLLSRDSRMQVLAGWLVGTAHYCPPLRPGDLLFFTTTRGNIGHVAISLGGHRFVHAVMPEVTLGSLDPDDPLYCATAKRFAFAKRYVP